jgi:glutamine amidotransferase
MCQIFAMSSKAPAAVTFAFSGFSARGGITGEHQDGFGLAFHHGRACRVFVDELPAGEAALAGFLRSHPIRAQVVVGHVRKATQGEVALVNCHPFVREWRGRYWSFCHHGDLKAFEPLLSGPYRPVGSTDSERAFCWILQELDLLFRWDEDLPWRVLARELAALAEDIGQHGNFNFLLSDGESLFVRAATRLHCVERQHPFPRVQLVDRDLGMDLAVANHPGDRMTLVATEPLTRDEPWQALEPGELLVLREGSCVERLLPRAAQRRASALSGGA